MVEKPPGFCQGVCWLSAKSPAFMMGKSSKSPSFMMGFCCLNPRKFSVELLFTRRRRKGTRAARAPGRGALGQTAGRREGEAAVFPLGE